MKTQIIVGLILLLFVSSCTKEVEIDIPGFEEKLVVDGRIETGQPPIVLLSNSKDIYSPTDLDAFINSFVSGATVTMFDGTDSYTLDEICTDNLPPGMEQFAADYFGIPADEIVNYHLCAYVSLDPNSFGQVGKSYTLTIEYNQEVYTGTTQIVQPQALDSLWWEPAGGETEWGFSWAKITDAAGGYDAYFWEARRLGTDINGDPIDNGYTPTYSPVFNDEFVDGKSFDFFYENPMSFSDDNHPDDKRGWYQLGDTVVIKLSKLDRNVYEFLEKKYIQIQTNGNPFASPTSIISNLEGGCLGVWAGYSPTFDTIVCGE